MQRHRIIVCMKAFCSWLLASLKTTMFTSLHVACFYSCLGSLKLFGVKKWRWFVVCVNVCGVIHVCVFYSSSICPPFLFLFPSIISSQAIVHCFSLLFVDAHCCSLLMFTNVCWCYSWMLVITCCWRLHKDVHHPFQVPF